MLANGLPDQVMADTVLRFIDETGENIAVFCSFQSSFTRFQYKAYVEQALREELSTTLRMGNLLYEAIGEDVATVLLHGPWLDNTVMTGMNYPFLGAVDKLIRDLPEDKKSFGVPVPATPFESLQVSGDYAEGYDSLTLGELAEGYISLGPLSSYEAVEPIPGFIDEENYREAIRKFPGPNPGAVSAADLNEYISTITRDLNETLKKFR